MFYSSIERALFFTVALTYCALFFFLSCPFTSSFHTPLIHHLLLPLLFLQALSSTAGVRVKGQLLGCTAVPVLKGVVMYLSYRCLLCYPTTLTQRRWPPFTHSYTLLQHTPVCTYIVCLSRNIHVYSHPSHYTLSPPPLFICPVKFPPLQLSSLPDLFLPLPFLLHR